MASTRLVRSEPALILDSSKRYLVVTDLHIGFESRFVANDIHLNPDDLVAETVQRLDSIIEAEGVDVLLLLGDVKSSIDSISKLEWLTVPRFFEIGKRVETIVIPGNHDGNLQKLSPDWVTISSPTGIVIEDVLLTHGHVMPSENLSHVNKIIMGHVHPVYFKSGSVLDGERVWVSIKTEKSMIFPSSRGEIEIIIMPSFNRYFYSASKKNSRRSISPIVEAVRPYPCAKVATLDGSLIGDETIISYVL